MKIYLLSIDRRRCFFYADDSEASDDDEAAGGGSSESASRSLWGRLHDRYLKLKETWEHSGSRVVRWTRRTWDWLHSWSHPDESMLVRLRSARRIDLNYPASRPADQVRILWDDYLTHRWWRHLLWMIVNGVIAPFTVVFAILPGPNVIGYWFAYRAIHHTLIVWGLRRARTARIPLQLHPVAALDRPIEVNEAGGSKHDAIDGQAVLLDEHVAWSESEPSVVIPPEAGRSREPTDPANPESRDA